MPETQDGGVRPIPAAMLIAAAGLVLFFLYHWFFIAPVWAVLAEGVLWVVVNGVAIGWAYQRTMLDGGRGGPVWGARFGALLAATLVPGAVVGLVHGPFPNGPSLALILPVLPLAFLGVPMSVVMAWGLTGWRRIAWPFVVACLPSGFMIGGSLAAFGGAPRLFLLFAAIDVAGGWALAHLAGSRRTQSS